MIQSLNLENAKLLQRDFFTRDVLGVAPDLIGKVVVRTMPSGSRQYFMITETEAYRGTDDKACHASKGMTPRTEVMFRKGGILYMYLIYGIHWMMNVVTSVEGNPQAVLIRGLAGVEGPGRLTRMLEMDGSFNGEDLLTSERIRFYDAGVSLKFRELPRVGIDYAGEYWKSVPWRYLATGDDQERIALLFS